MTNARKATLDILNAAEKPLSASEIGERISIVCDPVTIYRTLHYLEEHDYASSFVLHCTEHGTERYYTATTTTNSACNHHHWFHCEQCHTFIDLGNCRIESLVNGYEEELGIRVTGHTLYLTGICPDCAKKKSHTLNLSSSLYREKHHH